MLNPVSLQSTARNPRALIKINDIVIRKLLSIEYEENNYNQPDTFHVELPLYNVDDALTIEYLLSQPAILVEIYLGFPNDPINYGMGDLENMVTGGIDQLCVKIFDAGGLIQFSGRDLSSKFIDNKTVQKYPNLTSSQIATQLAESRGLTPVVTATQNKAGYYYNIDNVQNGNAVSEWDLLTYLAQREGFQVFVRGQSLYFQPQPTESSSPYVLQAQTLEDGIFASFNGSRLALTRNLNYARDVIVTVKSWNAKNGAVQATAQATPTQQTAISAQAQPVGNAQTFQYYIPGLNQQQALQRAQNILQDITLHERLLETSVPGDNLLRKDTVIKLNGVSNSANQIYYPDMITRKMSPEGGYQMQVRAKNHSPQNVVTI